MNAVEYTNKNWWDVSKITDFQPGPNVDQTGAINNAGHNEPVRETYIPFQQDSNRPRYGRPGYKWKAHGPTQSPFFDSVPGVNPTANPLNNGFGTLDDYYKIWLEYAAQQDEAQCALIPLGSRNKCMDNYEALLDKLNTQSSVTCKSAGCCFNEDSFLHGGAACYRATNYGQCRNLPVDFQKRECGYEGIGEQECLNNVKCCYQPSADREDPWCYEKYSATLDESQWCRAWTEEQYRSVPRNRCFKNPKSKSNMFNDLAAHDINNLISREQCENADCCYDDTLSADYLDWLTEGLGYGQNMFRCFRKENPLIQANANQFKDKHKQLGAIQNVAIDTNKFGDGTAKLDPHTLGPRIKTCDNTKWQMFGYDGTTATQAAPKRSCGENLSYYQCVYVNKCCYKPTVSNEPVCYYPEFKNLPFTSAGKTTLQGVKENVPGNVLGN